MAVPALIVGGGPAGAATAITLARAGLKPLLAERNATSGGGVCGGFLGWDALAALRTLGIDPAALGARPIGRLRLVTGHRTVEAALPHGAAGLSRHVLDSALLAAAERAGAIVTRGRTARAADPVRRTVRFDDGETVAADALFLATGKHDLRGLTRGTVDMREVPSIGLRATLPPGKARLLALAGTIELHLFDRGYAGLLLQEDGTANLCLSVARDRLGMAGSIPALLAELLAEAPGLADRVDGDMPEHFEAVAGVPYGWRAGETHAGIFRIGDQGAVIASLAGDGIAIALSSGMSAARAMIAGGPDAALDWQRGWERRCRKPLRVAEALRHGAASPVPRAMLMGLLGLMPGLATKAAALTRVGQDI